MRTFALSFFLVTLPLCAQVKPTGGPAPTAPTANSPQSPQPIPQIDPSQHWRNATVALGSVITVGGTERLVVEGSAVIVAVDEKRGCLLTAKHMIEGPASGIVRPALWMRLSSEHGEAMPSIPLDLVDSQGKATWLGAPASDLALIPIPWAKRQGRKLDGVSIKEFAATEDEIFQGAQILVLGYPQVFRNVDQTNPYSTSPIARVGIIAWTNPADPLGKPFLVDANLYGGNSGGPVFRVRNGFDRYGNFNIGNGGLAFIGIVSQGPTVTTPIIAGGGIVSRPNALTGVPETEYTVVPYVGGVGVIEPASRAMELLSRVFQLADKPIPLQIRKP